MCMTTGYSVPYECPYLPYMACVFLGIEHNAEVSPGGSLERGLLGDGEGQFLKLVCDIFVFVKVLATSSHASFRRKDGTSHISRSADSVQNRLVQFLNILVFVESTASIRLSSRFPLFVSIIPGIIALQYLNNIFVALHILNDVVPCWKRNADSLNHQHQFNFQSGSVYNVHGYPGVVKILQVETI